MASPAALRYEQTREENSLGNRRRREVRFRGLYSTYGVRSTYQLLHGANPSHLLLFLWQAEQAFANLFLFRPFVVNSR